MTNKETFNEIIKMAHDDEFFSLCKKLLNKCFKERDYEVYLSLNSVLVDYAVNNLDIDYLNDLFSKLCIFIFVRLCL